MNIYLDKLANVQVIINCQYFVAQMCTREDTLAQYLGPSFIRTSWHTYRSVIKCRYSVAQMCTFLDMLAQYLGALYLDDIMSRNEAHNCWV